MGFVCWRAQAENGWGSVPFAAIHAALPEVQLGVQDLSSGPGPFALADRDVLAGTLRAAGFKAVEIAPFDREVELSKTGLADAVHFAMTAGPSSRLLVQATPEQKARAADALTRALAPHLIGDRVALPGAAWIASAR
jgi:hypothetical protein